MKKTRNISGALLALTLWLIGPLAQSVLAVKVDYQQIVEDLTQVFEKRPALQANSLQDKGFVKGLVDKLEVEGHYTLGSGDAGVFLVGPTSADSPQLLAPEHLYGTKFRIESNIFYYHQKGNPILVMVEEEHVRAALRSLHASLAKKAAVQTPRRLAETRLPDFQRFMKRIPFPTNISFDGQRFSSHAIR